MAQDPRIDAYLAALPPNQRASLEGLRARIARHVPDAVETIGYGMPAFKLDSRGLIWFAGWKAHCSIYPLTDAFLAAHRDAFEGFGRTKGSVHFTPERPLPDDLLDDLIRARVADVERGEG